MSFADSFETFCDDQWPTHWGIPKADSFWRLLERWIWRQGEPGSTQEAEALAWAKDRYTQRYKRDPGETKLRPPEDKPPPKKPKARPTQKRPKSPVTIPTSRKPALVF